MQGWTVGKEKWRLNSERGALVGTACECDWLRTGREEQVRAGGQGGQAGWRTPEEEIMDTPRAGHACSDRKSPGCLNAVTTRRDSNTVSV